MSALLPLPERAQAAPAQAPFDAQRWCQAQRARIEQALEQALALSAPAALTEAMRYAVLDGGKRLRPLLVLAAQQALSSAAPAAVDPAAEPAATDWRDAAALRAACAVELIHAYSLVHDDLPCMDNDVLRRGKPTVHVRFGQALALLAGDALQAFAFELLTPAAGAALIPAATQAALCRLLAQASGPTGMAGGQAIDLSSVGAQLDAAQLQRMHSLKTGALLQASVLMGAVCGQPACAAQRPDAAPAAQRAYRALSDFGAALGLAFQVVDDVLDVLGDGATLGKTAGKDAAAGKPTWVSLLGPARAQEQARALLASAQAALARSGLPETRALAALAQQLVCRAC